MNDPETALKNAVFEYLLATKNVRSAEMFFKESNLESQYDVPVGVMLHNTQLYGNSCLICKLFNNWYSFAQNQRHITPQSTSFLSHTNQKDENLIHMQQFLQFYHTHDKDNKSGDNSANGKHIDTQNSSTTPIVSASNLKPFNFNSATPSDTSHVSTQTPQDSTNTSTSPNMHTNTYTTSVETPNSSSGSSSSSSISNPFSQSAPSMHDSMAHTHSHSCTHNIHTIHTHHSCVHDIHNCDPHNFHNCFVSIPETLNANINANHAHNNHNHNNNNHNHNNHNHSHHNSNPNQHNHNHNPHNHNPHNHNPHNHNPHNHNPHNHNPHNHNPHNHSSHNHNHSNINNTNLTHSHNHTHSPNSTSAHRIHDSATATTKTSITTNVTNVHNVNNITKNKTNNTSTITNNTHNNITQTTSNVHNHTSNNTNNTSNITNIHYNHGTVSSPIPIASSVNNTNNHNNSNDKTKSNETLAKENEFLFSVEQKLFPMPNQSDSTISHSDALLQLLTLDPVPFSSPTTPPSFSVSPSAVRSLVTPSQHSPTAEDNAMGAGDEPAVDLSIFDADANVEMYNKAGRFCCPFPNCTKSFSTSAILKRHIKEHSGDRPFKCNFEGCGKGFARNYDLKVHMRSHTGEKPYKCTFMGCERTFSRSSDLRLHERIHKGEKPFVCDCDGCQKRFVRYADLKKHKRTHEVHEGHHPHVHGAGCGHTAIAHEDHIDYLHDAHLHNHHKDHIDDHKISLSESNPITCTHPHTEFACDPAHTHNDNCGHELVPHYDHFDYLVDGHLHYVHDTHCDDHGWIDVVNWSPSEFPQEGSGGGGIVGAQVMDGEFAAVPHGSVCG